jgi:hypothetical protein
MEFPFFDDKGVAADAHDDDDDVVMMAKQLDDDNNNIQIRLLAVMRN